MMDRPITSSEHAANKERCAESFWVLQTMLRTESSTYHYEPITSESSGADYTLLRESLIEVLEETCSHLELRNQDTVITLAVSYLDRFIQKNHKDARFVPLQLAAATCLYLAIKVCDEPHKVSPTMLCDLFHQCAFCDEIDEDIDDEEEDVDAEDLQSFELQVLKALNWNLNPPTAMMFVHHILACLPRLPMFAPWKEQALEAAGVQLQTAQRAKVSTQFKPSTFATASLFNTAEKIPNVKDRTAIYKYLLHVVRKTSPEQQRHVLEARSLLKKLSAADVGSDKNDDDLTTVVSYSAGVSHSKKRMSPDSMPNGINMLPPLKKKQKSAVKEEAQYNRIVRPQTLVATLL